MIPKLEIIHPHTRAAIYARVSSDDRGKEGRNLQSQLEMCKQYALSKGYHIVAELPEDDRGVSGAEIDLPQLNKLREMAKAKEIDVLVVREIDRLSRNLAKQLIIEEELNRANVRIEYVLADYDDTPEGRLQKHVRATVAEYEREKIKERITRGKRNSVRNGSVMVNGHPAYGYRRVKKGSKWALEIDPDEAEIVRLVFQWYVYGDETGKQLSTWSITQKLSKLGVPTRQDKLKQFKKKRGYGVWAESTISYMLKNETYIGRWAFGKTIMIYGKRIRAAKDHELTVQVPAIIDKHTFNLAQQQPKKNKQFARRNKKQSYLLAAHIKCGCGSSMGGRMGGTANKTAYYRCAATQKGRRAHTCDTPHFHADEIEIITWNWLKSLLIDDKRLEESIEKYRQKQGEITAPIARELETIISLLAKKQDQYKRLLDLYLSGDIEKSYLIDRKHNLETDIAALETKRTELIGIQSAYQTNFDMDVIKTQADLIRTNIDLIDADYEAKRWLLDALKVKVTLNIEDGDKVAYIQCAFGEEDVKLSMQRRKVMAIDPTNLYQTEGP